MTTNVGDRMRLLRVPQSAVPLAPLTTLEVGGAAPHFFEAGDVVEVMAALAWAKDATKACRGPVEVRPFQDDAEE